MLQSIIPIHLPIVSIDVGDCVRSARSHVVIVSIPRVERIIVGGRNQFVVRHSGNTHRVLTTVDFTTVRNPISVYESYVPKCDERTINVSLIVIVQISVSRVNISDRKRVGATDCNCRTWVELSIF